MKRFATALFLVLFAAQGALAYETKARAAFILDYNTGTVLLDKDADTPLPPASMSKLMTLYMLFDALRDGVVTLDDTFTVSSKAKSMTGSTMFLNELDRPTVEELIQGIVVSSGNDATVVVAEGLAGSEDAFARAMNQKAIELGMTNSTFANASGWPNPNHRMSLRDLGILGYQLISEFPEYYGYFAQQEFDYKDRSPANRFNRNPLLRLDIGADGLKTGHTQEAGYGLVGSAKQGDRRIVFVFSGLDSAAERAREAQAMVNWSFRQFVEHDIVKEGQIIGQAGVWMGAQPKVDLVAPEDYAALLPTTARGPLDAEIIYSGPINAPIAKGDTLAELVFKPEGLSETRLPLVAAQDVPQGGFLSRMATAAMTLFSRVNQGAEGAL